MKKLLEIIGALLAIQGLAGLVHEWIGWFRLWVVVPYLEFLEGYEILANIGLVILGLLVMTASGAVKK
ncbi:hypothetical protein [Nonomuraea sp. NPDC023979]|uniref:hypothetical protein n=1 Tax=unclassified Nonomuraea TaxID=2593643 RepID=UPI00340062DD